MMITKEVIAKALDCSVDDFEIIQYKGKNLDIVFEDECSLDIPHNSFFILKKIERINHKLFLSIEIY